MTPQHITRSEKRNVLMDIRENMNARMPLMDALIATTDFICKPLDELESLRVAEFENHPALEEALR